jgi:hypothetical protein
LAEVEAGLGLAVSDEVGLEDIEVTTLVVAASSSLPVVLLFVTKTKVVVGPMVVVIVAVVLVTVSVVEHNSLLPSSEHSSKAHGSMVDRTTAAKRPIDADKPLRAGRARRTLTSGKSYHCNICRRELIWEERRCVYVGPAQQSRKGERRGILFRKPEARGPRN